MIKWLKRWWRKRDFKEVLWIQSGGKIIIRYSGDNRFVRGDWSDFGEYRDKDDLVFYHTHPPGSPDLSVADKKNMAAVRKVLESDYIFVLISEDRDGNRVEKLFMVKCDSAMKEVMITEGVPLSAYNKVKEDVIEKAWNVSMGESLC